MPSSAPVDIPKPANHFPSAGMSSSGVLHLAPSQPRSGNPAGPTDFKTMDWSIQMGDNPPHIHVSVTGRLELLATVQALRQVWSAQEESGIHRVLWDLRNIAVPRFSAEQVRELAKIQLKDRPVLPPARAAFLVEGDLSFGLGRMIAAYFSEAPVSLSVFRDLQEAAAWLAKED